MAPFPRPRSPRPQPLERLGVAEFLARQRAGTLPAGPRAELVGGVAEVPPLPSAAAVAAVVGLAGRLEAAAASWALPWAVQLQPPVRLGAEDLLRPDLAVLTAVPRFGTSVSYAAGEVLLVAEVVRDPITRDVRLPRFAGADVAEVWLLDLQRGWAEAFRRPARGRYLSRTLWYPGESVRAVSLGGVAVEALAAV